MDMLAKKLAAGFKMSVIDELLEYETNEINEVRNVLGLTNYFGLKKFFLDEFFDFTANKCTVMITRRCYLLAIWFLKYFIKCLNEFSKGRTDFEQITLVETPENKFLCIEKGTAKNYILTDRAVFASILGKNCNEKIESVSVLDDICIHGNSLESTKIDISSRFNIPVKSHVFMISSETVVSRPDKYEVVSERAQWRDLSQRIVDFINLNNIPYVSYLNTFVKSNVERNEFETLFNSLANNSELICRDFGEGNNRKYLGKSSLFVIEKQVNMSSNILKCVRFYYNDRTKTMAFVPYVIVKSLDKRITDKTSLQNFLKKYLTSKTCDNLTELYSDFNSRTNKNKSNVYHLVSCVASQAYGLYFFEKYLKQIDSDFYEIENNWEEDSIKCLITTFGYETAKTIKNKTNYLSWNDNTVDSSIVNINKDVFSSLIEFIDEYLDEEGSKSWIRFEHGAYAKNSASGPIELEQLIKNGYNLLNNESTDCKNELTYACLLGLMNLCDAGRMSIYIDMDTGKNMVKSGELGCAVAGKYFTQRFKDEIDNELLMNLLADKYYRYLLL